MKIKIERKVKTNKKIAELKVETCRKTISTLWLLLFISMTFGIYKNFTAIDIHTVHEQKRI